MLQEAEGSGLKGISGGFPFAMRIGRVLGPRVAVFAGLQYLGRRRTSTLDQDYRVSDRRLDQVTPPGDYRVEIAYPDYFLSARAWIPQLGVTVDLVQKEELDGRRQPGRRTHVRRPAHDRGAASPENGGGRLLDGIALRCTT